MKKLTVCANGSDRMPVRLLKALAAFESYGGLEVAEENEGVCVLFISGGSRKNESRC
jgi:hypothetical protein